MEPKFNLYRILPQEGTDGVIDPNPLTLGFPTFEEAFSFSMRPEFDDQNILIENEADLPVPEALT